MNWVWRNFLSIILHPFLSNERYSSLQEYYSRKYAIINRRVKIKRYIKNNDSK
jgi:hypothetical protein